MVSMYHTLDGVYVSYTTWCIYIVHYMVSMYHTLDGVYVSYTRWCLYIIH